MTEGESYTMAWEGLGVWLIFIVDVSFLSFLHSPAPINVHQAASQSTSPTPHLIEVGGTKPRRSLVGSSPAPRT